MKATVQTQKFLECVTAQVVQYQIRAVRRSALKRNVDVSGKEPRWLSNVRPVKFRGFDDSTQHSQGAVELGRDLGEKMIRFVTNVVPGNSELAVPT